MKAQRSLVRSARKGSDDEDDEGDLEEDSEEDEFEADRRKVASSSRGDSSAKKEQVMAQLQEAAQAKEAKERRERRAKERQEAAREIEKRSDKHA